ncbi:hypothetical protein [Magnetospirillum sp. UT-4]|uniref:hypothetical protein n=1 Tax=Magnetospirillum sp. UT-4 TaxID=2681467 RepID=UPI0013857DC0|nr:hypothetical protein [Magnetospirillum sp. UT-4]CAA7625673.1 exported hypothetical protein [Magnetospirillum sp. UT-4]
MRRFLAGLLLLLSGLAPADAETLRYCGFQAVCREMEAWKGERVTVLTPPGQTYDGAVMGRLVADYDRAWAAYERLVGAAPGPRACCTIDGRASVAQSPDEDRVAAARGHMGGQGIELYRDHFPRIYREFAASGRHDHIVIHEMGRNFWLWRPQLGAVKAFEVGFAVANKFLVMERAGLEGAPFRDMSFRQLRASLDETWALYRSTPGLDWKGALLESRLPPHPRGWGANDLAAALWWRTFERLGESGYPRFFAALSARPKAATADEAVANFVAAGRAAGADLSELFLTGQAR